MWDKEKGYGGHLVCCRVISPCFVVAEICSQEVVCTVSQLPVSEHESVVTKLTHGRLCCSWRVETLLIIVIASRGVRDTCKAGRRTLGRTEPCPAFGQRHKAATDTASSRSNLVIPRHYPAFHERHDRLSHHLAKEALDSGGVRFGNVTLCKFNVVGIVFRRQY